MFSVSDGLLTLLQSRSRDLIMVCEFYAFDYVPFPDPISANLAFDPRHALKRFARQNITFNLDGDGVVYERQVIEFPSIQLNIGKQFDTATIRLSNVDRSTATWVLSERTEGMRMVIRVISRSGPSNDPTSFDFADSFIRFVGRVNKPDSFNRQSGTISATQDLGSIEAQIPPRLFQPNCPLKFKGTECLGSEALSAKTATYKAAKICNKSFAQCTEYSNTEFFQGTRIVQVTSSFVHKSNESFFKKILNIFPGISRKKTTVGSSIHDGTPYGTPISVILGRWKKDLIPIQYQDIGTSINFKMAACRGTITDFLNIVTDSVGFTQPHDIAKHKGDYGGVGTQTQDTVFPDQSFHSKLAYITGQCDGSNIEAEEAAPPISSVVVGLSVLNASGTVSDGRAAVGNIFAGYTTSYWSDNPVDLARHVITDPALLGLSDSHVSNRATIRTSSYTLGPIKDVSNSERCLLPDTETSKAGVDYKRYQSTSVISGLSFHYGDGATFGKPFQTPGGQYLREATYEFFDPDAPPDSLELQIVYRKRYSANIEVNEQKKAIDFLYDTLLSCFRGFIRWDQNGLLAIDCERPADHTYLREDVSASATEIKVLDVFPWAPPEFILNEPNPLRGKLLIGAHKLTSEVRRTVNDEFFLGGSTEYSADGNGITLAASATGSLTASVSGATLSGGSSSTPASGVISIGGTPSVGDTVTATIDGYEIELTVEGPDTNPAIPDALIVAERLSYMINAEPILQNYVVANSGSSATEGKVTIKAKYGVLKLFNALEEDHFAEIDAPSSAPVLAASAGSLEAGAYLVSYAYRNTNGNTTISPIASITLTASQQIDVTAVTPLPAGADSVDWFVSVEADSGVQLLLTNNDGSAFSINSLPESTDDDVPKINTTGEEILRVEKSFAQRALTYADSTRSWTLDGSFNWPQGGKQSTINQVKARFRYAILDFAEQPIVVNDERHQETIGKVNTADIDLSAVDNFNQASRLMNGYLAKLRDGDFFFEWGSAGDALLLEIGDVVCLSDDSGEWRNVPVRIESINCRPDFTALFTGRLYSTSQFDDAVLQTDVPLPSALVNFKSAPPDLAFNAVDFPPAGLVQSTDGTAGITSIRGGLIFSDSIYSQYAKVRLIKRGGVTVDESINDHLIPDSNGEGVFEFIASIDGLYTVQAQACNQWGCSTAITADIVIGFGSLYGLATEAGELLLTEASDILEVEH